jgi:hypothetical protein
VPPRFVQAERSAAALRARYQAGELDEATYETQLHDLAFKHGDGSYWMLDADGEWLRHDGKQWVREEPPLVAAPPKRPPLGMAHQPVIAEPAPVPSPTPVVPITPEVVPAPSATRTGKALPWKWIVVGGGGLLAVGVIIVGVLVLSKLLLPGAGGGSGGPEATTVAEVTHMPTMTSAPSVLPTPTPSATTAPVLTPEPTPQSTPQPTVIPVFRYSDDFSDPESGWRSSERDAGSAGYGSGYYYITSGEASQPVWARALQDLVDVVVRVDATQVLAPVNNNNSYGIGCRIQSNGDGYYLLISGEGRFGIFKAVYGDYEPLVDWTQSDVINGGDATNHIQAMCGGTTLSLFVNGQQLASVRDDVFSGGDIALQAATFEAESTEVHFNNLLAEEPRTVYLPVAAWKARW